MDFLERIAALRREGQSFAVATVVARRPPVSAHLGDHAIVFADGRMEGFVGGSCSREIVRRQALEALGARYGRLVSITPDPAASTTSTGEHVVVPMTCASEGAVDVYIEPFVRARRLIVVGATPVAAALARVARAMECDVVRVVDAREKGDVEAETATLGITLATIDSIDHVLADRTPADHVVVASQGHYDEEALESILKHDIAYVGLVASRKRGETIRALLAGSAAPAPDRIRFPAGLDLGARTPPEVALSIFAEIVQLDPAGAARRADDVRAATPSPTPVVTAVAVDPVCGMNVDVASARHMAEVDDVRYYFCCPHCRAAFLKNPDQYRAAAS